jgi:hypothetical protein
LLQKCDNIIDATHTKSSYPEFLAEGGSHTTQGTQDQPQERIHAILAPYALPVGEQGQQEENTRQNVCTSNNTRNLRKSNKVKSCKTIMLEDMNVQHGQDIPDNEI